MTTAEVKDDLVGAEPLPGAVAEEKDLVRFEQVDEFLAILHGPDFMPEMLGRDQLERSDDQQEAKIKEAKSEAALKKLMSILDLYQEQSYLLDPYLDTLVKPSVNALQEIVRLQYAARSVSSSSTLSSPSSSQNRAVDASRSEMERLARLLYYFTKVRGYKTIVHFFPHAVGDLQPTLTLLETALAPEKGDISSAAAPAASYASSSSTPSTWSTWEVRYILLLWLSLICMIPFDLVKFDSTVPSEPTSASGQAHSSSRPGAMQSKETLTTTTTTTQKRIEAVAKAFLASPGKERDAAAILLGKLFQRKDASKDGIDRFLAWSREVLLPPSSPSVFLAPGILQTVCSILKTSSAETLSPHMADISRLLSLFSADEDEARDAVGGGEPIAREVAKNSLVARYRAKMACRMGIKVLRPRTRQARGLKTRHLGGENTQTSDAGMSEDMNGQKAQGANAEDEEDEDVPEELDNYIGKLLDALQDKDTAVRYSAAKGLARLCTRLPSLFIDQVAQAVTDLFSINVVDFLGNKEDLSNVSEHTWQGACLALAELARRGLLRSDDLGEKLGWVQKALVFDVRRGAHSVGTGVRDAACYVLWALARAHDADAIRPYAQGLSHQLVCVTLFDRDISIRRAASAAFQECVGRLGLFAHGIDVIRKTDFFAVSVRRNAFLQCAPQVAVHAEYRHPILEHALSTTVFHWDVTMRDCGALAVAKIAQIDLVNLAPKIVDRMKKTCSSRDMLTLHGSLLTLAEISAVCNRASEVGSGSFGGDGSDDGILERCRADSFKALELIPLPSLQMSGSIHVLRGACRLIETSCSAEALKSQLGKDQQVTSPSEARWEAILRIALARQEEDIHLSAAQAWGAVSRCRIFVSCATTIFKDWRTFNIAEQQSHTRVLGQLHFANSDSNGPKLLDQTMKFLFGLLRKGTATYSTNVETRRNAVVSITSALSSILRAKEGESYIALERTNDALEALLGGLEDYTTDARGDVGSWVRMACLTGLGELLDAIDHAQSDLPSQLPQSLFDKVVAGIIKQMVERIDGMRAEAGKQLLTIINRTRHPNGVVLYEQSFLTQLLAMENGSDPTSCFKDPKWIYPRAIDLLVIQAYRNQLLEGLVLSIGSSLEMAHHALGESLCDLVRRDGRPHLVLATKGDEGTMMQYPPPALLKDLALLASRNVSSNRLFVPTLQTTLVLLQGDAFSESDKPQTIGIEAPLQKLLALANRSVDKIKSPQRVLASMQLTLELVGYAHSKDIVKAAVGHGRQFLLHAFPTIRGATAEALYVVVQDHFYDALQELEGGDEVEDILLLTPWTQKSPLELKETVDQLLMLIGRAIEASNARM